jgi:transposase
MSNKRYTDEFKIEAVKQVTERGHAVVDVATRLDVSQHSLYQWVKRFSVPPAERKTVDDQHAEIRRLKAELKRVSEERDILKKAATYFAKQSG